MNQNPRPPETLADNHRIAAFGLGTAGCRILSHLSKGGIRLGKHHFASCSRSDLCLGDFRNKIHVELPVGGKISQRFVRGAAQANRSQIKKALTGVDNLFVFAGLGGKVGSALAPFVAGIAKEMNISCFSVLVMPFKFEKNKHFTAGVALRWIRRLSDGIILVDNDEILERFPQAPLQESYEQIDRSLALAVGRLVGMIENKDGASLDIDKLLGAVKSDGYSVLGLSRSSTPHMAIKGAIKSISKTADPREAKKAILFMAGDGKLSASDLTSATSTIESVIGGNLANLDQGYSIGGSVSSAVLLASGIPTTKFDRYDPLGSILAGREIDFDPESSIQVNLESLDNIE